MMHCPHNDADPPTIHGGRYDQTGICVECGQYLERFFVDGDEDRRGRWSRWKTLRLVIEEEPDLSWSVSDSSNI